jgi:hypothetical protein
MHAGLFVKKNKPACAAAGAGAPTVWIGAVSNRSDQYTSLRNHLRFPSRSVFAVSTALVNSVGLPAIDPRLTRS